MPCIKHLNLFVDIAKLLSTYLLYRFCFTYNCLHKFCYAWAGKTKYGCPVISNIFFFHVVSDNLLFFLYYSRFYVRIFLNIIACVVDYLPKIWTLTLSHASFSLVSPQDFNLFIAFYKKRHSLAAFVILFSVPFIFFFSYFSCFGWLSLFFAHSSIWIFILLASIFLWTIALQCNFFLIFFG